MKIRVIRDYCGEEGTDVDKNVHAGTEHVVSRARGNALFANGLVKILEDEAGDWLRQDGPTVAEYVTAGYSAANYPPAGYASRSTADEIAEAIKQQEAGTPDQQQDVNTMTNPTGDTKAATAPANKQAAAPNNKAASAPADKAAAAPATTSGN